MWQERIVNLILEGSMGERRLDRKISGKLKIAGKMLPNQPEAYKGITKHVRDTDIKKYQYKGFMGNHRSARKAVSAYIQSAMKNRGKNESVSEGTTGQRKIRRLTKLTDKAFHKNKWRGGNYSKWEQRNDAIIKKTNQKITKNVLKSNNPFDSEGETYRRSVNTFKKRKFFR